MNKKFEKYDFLIPGFITLIVSVSVIIWLKLDNVLPHWDMGRHLLTTLSWKEIWYGFFNGEKSIFGLLSYYPYYPPLIYNVGWPFYLIFGRNGDAITYSNVIWITILVFSVYKLSRIYFSKIASTCSVLFILAVPMVVGQMREFQTDMPLTASFALFLYFLLKSDLLSNKKTNFYLGIAIGIGMVTKWSFAFFAGPAFLVYFIAALLKSTDKKTIIKNTLSIIGVSLLVFGPWYGRNAPGLMHDFKQNGYAVAVGEGDPIGFNKVTWIWYWKYIFQNYLTLPLTIFVVIGIIVGFVKARKMPIFAFFLFLFVFYYSYFSYLPNKDIRYIMPAMVPLAFLAGLAINSLKNKYFQGASLSVLILVLVANHATVSFGKYIKADPKWLNYKIGEGNFGIITTTNGYTATSPRKEFCSMDQMAKSIPEGKKARLVGGSPIEFNGWTTGFYLKKNNRVWAEEIPPDLTSDYLFFRNYQETMEQYLARTGYKSAVELSSSFRCSDETTVYTLKVK